MFRENVLTDDGILDRIGSTMVPVAVDRWKAEAPGTEEARFLQPFLKEHPPQGSPCIYSPDGKVLGGFHGFDDMAGRTRKLIEEALKRFGPVTPRNAKAVETHSYRGRGTLPDGSVLLAEYVRPSRESLKFLNTETPVIASVRLGKEEFTAFAPTRSVVGTRWTLPRDVAAKLARVTSPLCYQHAPKPSWVTSVRITAEVGSVEGHTARLRYVGRIASTHRVRGQTISVQDVELSGEGIYDIGARTMRSVLLVGSGTLHWPEAPEKRVAFDALVEWTLEPDTAVHDSAERDSAGTGATQGPDR